MMFSRNFDYRFLMTTITVVFLHAAPVVAATSDDVPLEITADKALEWNDTDKTYVARGAAQANKGNMQIKADILTAYYGDTKSASSDIVKMKAQGHVEMRIAHEQDRQGDDIATGDGATYDLTTGVAVLEGERPKIIKAGRDTLEADTITVQMDMKDGQVLQTMNNAVATGNVVVTSSEYRATGARAVYTTANNTAEISGHVVITQGKNVIEGESATTNLTTHVSRVIGQKGAGRVKGIFYPGTGKKR